MEPRVEASVLIKNITKNKELAISVMYHYFRLFRKHENVSQRLSNCDVSLEIEFTVVSW